MRSVRLRIPVRFKHFLVLSLLGSATAICVFSCLGLLAPIDIGFDTFNHFRLQYAVCLLAAVGICSFLRLKKYIVLFGVFAILNILPVLYLYSPPPSGHVVGSEKLKILNMNLWFTVRDSALVLERIRETDPDIIVFQELTPRTVQALKPALARYMFSEIKSVNDPSGCGIFSRIPLKSLSQSQPFLDFFTIQYATFQIGPKSVTLVNLHTFRPPREDWLRADLAMLDFLQKLRQKSDEMILIGDYNATPWSYYFLQLTNKLKLQDTELGMGPQFSWPSYAPLLYLPIDHCCISSGISLCTRKVLRPTKSDHLPLFVELAI